MTLAFIRKLIMELALGVPYGNWNERLMRRLSELGLNRDEWEDSG